MDCGLARGVGRLPSFRRSALVAAPPSRSRSVRVFASEGSRQRWEIGRFLKTVLFFNDPLKTVLRTFAQSDVSETVTPEAPSSAGVKVFGPMQAASPPILLLGGNSEIGRPLTMGMIQSGRSLLARTTNVESERENLGKLEHSPDSTLEVFQWNEGDVVPEAVSDAKTIAICDSLSSHSALLKTLLKSEREVYAPSYGVGRFVWGPLDDVVMGGCSQSELTVQRGRAEKSEYAAVFSGNITAANNGGFASVRTKNLDPPLDLSEYDGLKIRLQGDGQRYKFMLRTTTDWDSISYCKSFDTQDGWQDVKLSFKDFFPVFRAKFVKPPPALELNHISSLQLMLSKFEYDGELNPSVKMGRFELPIENITAYKDDTKIPQVMLLGGSEEDQNALKTMTPKYTIINPDPEQEGLLGDSTFVTFVMTAVSEERALGMTFKEKTRSTVEEALSFDDLIENFSKE